MRTLLHLVLFLVAMVATNARAGFDYDRRVSEKSFDCGDLFEKPCGIESPDNLVVVGDSVVTVWEGDYNAEYGVLYADRSSNGGGTWGTDVTTIDQQRSMGPRVIASSPITPSSVVIGWVTYDGLGQSLFLDVSYDWMRSFAYTRNDCRVTRGVPNTSAADLTIGDGDTLVVVFARRDTLWAKFSTVSAPSVWSDSLALFVSANAMDDVDVEACANGGFGVVWREKVNGRGVIRALTFTSPVLTAMPVEPFGTNVVGKRKQPINVVERPAVNTLTVSDDTTADYSRPCLRYCAGEVDEPGAWWIAFYDARKRILIDRRAATPTASWGADIPLDAPNVDMPALAVAQAGGIEFVVVGYRQWGDKTLTDVGEFDGSFTWTDRESVTYGHFSPRVDGHAVVVLGMNPLQYGVAYTPVDHNGIGVVWFKAFTYSP